MTPKEKANELVERYVVLTTGWNYIEVAKKCALMRVNEILEGSMLVHVADYNYWTDVKQEINKI